MPTASRRIFLYWLLLIIPALVVGAAALWLLRREQLRINEQAAAAAAARQAAVQARTRLIAENIDVIITDVETGLMGTLLDAPVENPDDYLANWRDTNPLVHDVFVATSAGALRWGARDTRDTQSAPVAAWLATKPWRASLAQPATAPPSLVSDSDNAMKQSAMPEPVALSGNTRQYQSARVAMQTMAAFNNNIAIAPPPQNQSLIQADIKIANADAKTNAKAREESATIIPALAAPAPDLTGWTPWTDATGALHLFGWRLTSRGAVFVVEANLAAIASRLGEVLPRDIAPDESYALFGNGTENKNKNGTAQIARVDGNRDGNRGGNGGGSTRDTPARQIDEQPLGLPGWRVAGYTLADATSGGSFASGGAFFLVSALLVGLFVLAIIGGGSLLLRQARLSAADSAQKTSFVANVSHEFKTPLTTIRLYSELLEQGRIRDDAQRAESLRTISRETQRLARLVNNALDFSRLEQGRKKFNLAEHDLRDEIARIVERHAPRIAEAGLKLDLMRTAAPCVTRTDLDAVEQIVLNLLDNACKYAASGGEVTVTVAQKDKVAGASSSRRKEQDAPPAFKTVTVTVTVADRGPGIPAAHREKIFEKFHRVDDTLTTTQSGAGLGLGIARQLARGLGGDLAYTPREGGGSEFTLTLHSSLTLNP